MLTRPFPGITFQSEIPTAVSLPRMDIAAFVGFAGKGPLNLPVAIESYLDFVKTFGDRYSLAWDSESNIQQTACLAPCVESFFSQGGQRCWVVRVAQVETAETATFPLAGLLKTTPGGYIPLSAQARYPGSWSDTYQAKAELLVSPQMLPSTTVQADADGNVHLSLQNAQNLQAGDLLQLDFHDQRHRAYVAVPGQQQIAETLSFKGQKAYWFHRLRSLDAAQTAGNQSRLEISGNAQEFKSALSFAGTLALASTGTGTLVPTVPFVIDLEAGDWLKFKGDGKTFWLLVASISADSRIELSSVWTEGIDTANRSWMEASVQALKTRLQSKTTSDSEYGAPLDSPLIMDLLEGEVALPLGLDNAMPWRSAQISNRPALVRDGLVPQGKDYTQLTQQDWQTFITDIFLDPSLRRVDVRALLSEASARYYIQAKPLIGIHSLFPIDEVSLIALPDAAHTGWRLLERQSTVVFAEERSTSAEERCDKSNVFKPCTKEKEKQQTDHVGNSTLMPTASTVDWQLLPAEEDSIKGLLEVQRSLVRFVTARGDAIAILDLPKHYSTAAVTRYQQQLSQQIRTDGNTTDSYTAIYHPWLVNKDINGALEHTSPTGSISGIMATQSLRKGAWTAAANKAIQNMIATVSPLNTTEEKTLHAAHINPIRFRPQGLVTWNNATLSSDLDLANIGVRRLLILLKRLAVREGQRYAFSSHTTAFRRRIKQQFENILTRLFDLGAFAGSSPAEAFQVVIEDAASHHYAVEQGQMKTELRIAPSQPMTFITVRLIQTSHGLTVQEDLINGD